MERTTCLAVFFLWCLGLLLAAGCGDSGPELGEVTGTVTLDGKPVPKATVEFQPTAPGGSPSDARTNENGRYELMYGVGKPGAMVGKHVVRITTARQDREDPEGPVIDYPEILPARYHEQSDLKRKVESGSQEFDFELNSR